MSSSLILAWLVCRGPGGVLLPVRLMDGNASQKSFNPACQKLAFKKKTGQSDSTESWASPVGKAAGAVKEDGEERSACFTCLTC